jgi:hypothetical protein
VVIQLRPAPSQHRPPQTATDTPRCASPPPSSSSVDSSTGATDGAPNRSPIRSGPKARSGPKPLWRDVDNVVVARDDGHAEKQRGAYRRWCGGKGKARDLIAAVAVVDDVP